MRGGAAIARRGAKQGARQRQDIGEAELREEGQGMGRGTELREQGQGRGCCVAPRGKGKQQKARQATTN